MVVKGTVTYLDTDSDDRPILGMEVGTPSGCKDDYSSRRSDQGEKRNIYTGLNDIGPSLKMLGTQLRASQIAWNIYKEKGGELERLRTASPANEIKKQLAKFLDSIFHDENENPQNFGFRESDRNPNESNEKVFNQILHFKRNVVEALTTLLGHSDLKSAAESDINPEEELIVAKMMQLVEWEAKKIMHHHQGKDVMNGYRGHTMKLDAAMTEYAEINAKKAEDSSGTTNLPDAKEIMKKHDLGFVDRLLFRFLAKYRKADNKPMDERNFQVHLFQGPRLLQL